MRLTGHPPGNPRSVLAMHKLIDNKEGRMWREKAKHDKAAADKEWEKAKDTAAAADGEAAGGKDQGSSGDKDKGPSSNGNVAKK